MIVLSVLSSSDCRGSHFALVVGISLLFHFFNVLNHLRLIHCAAEGLSEVEQFAFLFARLHSNGAAIFMNIRLRRVCGNSLNLKDAGAFGHAGWAVAAIA